MIALLKKELLGLWRTGRVIGVVAVMLLFAIAGPAVIRFLPDMIGGQLPEGVQITLPEMSGVDGFLAFLQNASQMGFLVIILVAMGAVAAERSSGVAASTFAMPVAYRDYLLSKLVSYGALVALAMVLAGVVAWGYSQLLLGPLAIEHALAATALYALWALAILSWTLLFSTLFRSQLLAGGLSLVPLFGFPLLESLTGRAGDYTPFAVLPHGDGLLQGSVDGALWVALAACLGLVLLCVGGAVVALRRAELA